MNASANRNDLISSTQVEGTTVYYTAGDKLGTVDNLMIDKRSGQVLYAVLEFGGFLGMGVDRYPLPWKMLHYDPVKDGYVVPLDITTLDQAPRYPDDDRPAYTTDYGSKVDTYYGASTDGEWRAAINASEG